MQTIQVDYDAVEAKLSQMRNHITTNVNHATMHEYRQIQNNLMQVDGATQNTLQQVMELNRQKAMVCTGIMERLFNFMANSSRQIQISEEQIARAFNNPRRS